MRKREWSLDQIMDQAIALTVSCRDCGEPAGKKCSKTDWRGVTETLDNLPAHPRRIKDARRAQVEQEAEDAPVWETVPAGGMFVSKYRGRIVDLASDECSFTGTSPAPEGHLHLHGTAKDGSLRVQRFHASQLVRVKAIKS